MGNGKEKFINFVLALLLVLFSLWAIVLVEPLSNGQPYNSTVLVNATVNITNAAPLITYINLETPINLQAYGTTNVTCNLTVYDYDNNTDRVNASLYVSTVLAGSAEDQNTRYANRTCSRTTPNDYYSNFSCTFNVSYFANNGTWYCNATAYDVSNATGNNISNSATINPLVAIKMPLVLDYGNLDVNAISNDTVTNITNAGNRNINISVSGYGSAPGDGLSFVCSSGSIPISYERYDIVNGSSFGFMNPLTGTDTMLFAYFIAQRTSETTDSINQTYWKVQIPPGPGGVCNGKILFTASDKGS